jgi:hypothetical protein
MVSILLLHIAVKERSYESYSPFLTFSYEGIGMTIFESIFTIFFS